MTKIKVLSFEEAWVEAQANKGKNCSSKIRILLGNGFSMAYDPNFAHTTLFNAIKDIKENKLHITPYIPTLLLFILTIV